MANRHESALHYFTDERRPARLWWQAFLVERLHGVAEVLLSVVVFAEVAQPACVARCIRTARLSITHILGERLHR
jgi:hypothetical protein